MLGVQFSGSMSTGFYSSICEFIVDEPIPECRAIVVHIITSVDDVGAEPFPLGEKVSVPLKEGLLAKTKYPADHRQMHPDRGIWWGQSKD